ncbi:lipocalin-like domain-containing protein [Halomonas sp. WWR20]
MKTFLYSTRHIGFILGGLLAAVLLIAALAWLIRSSTEPPAAQSFAGLGSQAAGYAQARPGNTLDFPQDHGPHPDYRIEWWYLTANLHAEDGTPYGVQWTLFRQAIAPPGAELGASDDPHDREAAASPWASRQLWMAHAALSTPDDHYVAERFARGGIRQAGVEAEPFSAWLDDWRLACVADTGGFDRLMVHARDEAFTYRLALDAEGPLVLHGKDGFSQKSADGQGSMYYSQPFYRVSGEVQVDGEPVAVTGRAWLDREWSSQLLGAQQRGWDWFSLHLDSGAKLMAFRLRGAGDEENAAYISGSWITPQGRVTPLQAEDLQLQPLRYSQVAGRQVPTQWRLHLPARQLDVTVRARQPQRWMQTTFPYWEGNVVVTGSHVGEGYLEMTGY